jgi:hypothetical protein
MNIAAADHGPPLIFEPPLCRQPPLNSALASSQLFLCSVIHSKCLSCLDWSTTKQRATVAKRQAFGVIL